MSTSIFRARLPGFSVGVVEHKHLPDCRPEFRCFYLPRFKRVTIRVLEENLFVMEQTKYFDLVYISDLWNVVVKEADSQKLQHIGRDEVIWTIKHRFAKIDGADYDEVIIVIRSLTSKIFRSFKVCFKHTKDFEIPFYQ